MIENNLIYFLNTNGVFLLFFGILIFLLLGGRKNQEVLRHVVLVFFITLITTILVKELFDRPRPFEVSGTTPLAGLTLFPSFPSSHAALAFAVSVTVAMHKRRLGIFLLVLSTLIALGRIVAGVHYPSDVAFGILLGVSIALFFDTFHVKLRIRRRLTK